MDLKLKRATNCAILKLLNPQRKRKHSHADKEKKTCYLLRNKDLTSQQKKKSQKTVERYLQNAERKQFHNDKKINSLEICNDYKCECI